MKILTLILLLALTGCAQQSYRLNPECPSSAGDEVVLLDINDGNTNTQLVLHEQKAQNQLLLQRADKQSGGAAVTARPGGEIIVALNPVGVPLFVAQLLPQGDIIVKQPSGYRYPDAASIIWAYSLWRQRDQAVACWPSAGTQLQQTPSDLTLRSGARILAQWHAQSPQVILLPQEKLRISVRRLD